LALVLANGVQAEPVADNACAVDAAECIVITQSADPEVEREPGVAANTATVTLDGEQTTILAYEDLAQSGNGNTADFAITGDQNTFLFSQTGNSILAITVNGNANTVTLFELGGIADRLASLTLDIAGDANTVDILSQRSEAVAELLDIDILGMNNILEVKFEDFADILTSIMGDGNTVKIAQNNPMMDYGQSAVTLMIQDAESRNNIVNILQNGAMQSIAVKLDGAENRLNLTQSDDYGMDNMMDVKLFGSSNNVDVNQRWDRNEIRVDLVGNHNSLNVVQEYYTAASVVQRGSLNKISLDLRGDQNVRIDLRGDINEIDLQPGWGGYYFHSTEPNRDMTISGRKNVVRQFVYGMEFGRSKIVITGNENSYEVMDDAYGMYPDWENMALLRENIDILGDGNRIFFDNFDSTDNNLMLHAKVRGDANTFDMFQSVGLSFNVEGSGNLMRFDDVRAADYEFHIGGDGNDVDVKDSILKNSATWITGQDNTLKAYGLAPRLFNNEIIGDSNIMTLNDQAGISAMFAYQTVILGSQNVLTLSSEHEGSYDPADYVGSVVLEGDRNTVSVTHGLASFDVNLVGNDHTFDVTYDPALKAYTHAVTAVGSGSAVFTSENGVVTITRSGT
jgi:hypothetical protein